MDPCTQSLKATRSFCSAVALIALSTAPTRAQGLVRGQVIDSLSRQPVVGAVAWIWRGADSVAVLSTLTDDAGRYALKIEVAGEARVSVRAIGFAPTTSSVRVGAGENVVVNFALTRNVVRVTGVLVAERNGCATPDALPPGGPELWSDVWAALSASIVSREAPVRGSTIMRYVRELDPLTARVRNEKRTSAAGRLFTPFVAANAAELAREGFVREGADGELRVYAPDAATFVSPAFIAKHCFALVAADSLHIGSIGILFWPHRDFASRGVEGTFWVDEHTRELQEIAFTFPRLADLPQYPLNLGGHATFTRRSDAGWYVSRWWLRSPVVRRETRIQTLKGQRLPLEARDSVVGIAEEGGVVLAVNDSSSLGVVHGIARTIVDAPIANARLELLGTDLTTATDSFGRFRFSSVLPGTYTLRAWRPGVDDDSALFVVWSTQMHDRETLMVTIDAPSTQTQAKSLCGGRRSGSSPSVPIVTIAREQKTGRPVPLRTFEVRWISFAIEGRSRAISWKTTIRQQTTDSAGVFRLCDAPANTQISFREATRSDAPWTWPVRSGVHWTVIELGLDPAHAVPDIVGAQRVAILQSQIASDNIPISRIEGIIVASDSLDTPLSDVHIALDEFSTGIVTGTDGRFALDSITLGAHTLQLRRAGFLDVLVNVNVGQGLNRLSPVRMEKSGRLLKGELEGAEDTFTPPRTGGPWRHARSRSRAAVLIAPDTIAGHPASTSRSSRSSGTG